MVKKRFVWYAAESSPRISTVYHIATNIIEEAILARESAETQYHGDFASHKGR